MRHPDLTVRAVPVLDQGDLDTVHTRRVLTFARRQHSHARLHRRPGYMPTSSSPACRTAGIPDRTIRSTASRGEAPSRARAAPAAAPQS